MKRSFIFTIAVKKPIYIIVLISNITNQLIKEKAPIQKGKGEDQSSKPRQGPKAKRRK
jgi:hypothetical protein